MFKTPVAVVIVVGMVSMIMCIFYLPEESSCVSSKVTAKN